MKITLIAYLVTFVLVDCSRRQSRATRKDDTAFGLNSLWEGVSTVATSIGTMAVKASSLVVNSFNYTNNEMVGLQTKEIESLVKPQSGMSTASPAPDSSAQKPYVCPPKFSEPSNFDIHIIKSVLHGLEWLSTVPILTNPEMKAISENYVFAKDINTGSQNPLTMILFRAPVQYTSFHTPALQMWFHQEVEKHVGRVVDFVKTKPKNQFIFAGVGRAASFALLSAWIVHFRVMEIWSCGKGMNKLNQLTVMMFGGCQTVTSTAMAGFKLQHKNVIDFQKHPAKAYPQEFHRIGLLYETEGEARITERFVGSPEAEKLVHNESDWSVALNSDKRDVILKSAAEKLVAQHNLASYFMALAPIAFEKNRSRQLHRNFHWGTDMIMDQLQDSLGIDGYRPVDIDCSVLNPSYELKTAVVSCSITFRHTGMKLVHKFVEFDIAVSNSHQKSIDMLKKQTKSQNPETLGDWNACIAQIMKDSSSLKLIDPSNRDSIHVFEYTKKYSDKSGFCAARLRSTTQVLKELYSFSPALFYQLFYASGRFRREIPKECLRLVEPKTISESEMGNADALYKSVKQFTKELSNIVTYKNPAIGTENFDVTGYWSSIPSEYPQSEVLEFPSCMQPLMSILLNCIAEKSTSLVDCREKENQVTGTDFCPAVCSDPRAPYSCSRVMNCGSGVAVGFRGDGRLGVSSARNSFNRRIKIDTKIGEFVNLCIRDRPKTSYEKVTNRAFFLTVFINTSATELRFERSPYALTPIDASGSEKGRFGNDEDDADNENGETDEDEEGSQSWDAEPNGDDGDDDSAVLLFKLLIP